MLPTLRKPTARLVHDFNGLNDVPIPIDYGNDQRSMSTVDWDDVKENDETMIISSSDKQRTNKQKVIEKTSN